MTTDFEISNNNKPDVNYYWGAKEIDSEGVNRWDPDDVGQIIWNEEFDPSTEES